MPLNIGSSLGPYEITASIGVGGMGEVYRAHDRKLNRDVAIKVLPQLFASDPERLARFERETQALAALNHPNIAQIHGVLDEPAALVMELVEGEDLAGRLARGPLRVDEAIAIARQIADALETAHERGIIHRDLKPANVKVRPDGAVKVVDFGLAKAVAGEHMPQSRHSLENSPTVLASSDATIGEPMTQIGVILGTATYMAPEQARGKAIDRRVDIWSFGCVLYEMLTGRRPFEAETVTDVLAAIVSREPDWSALPAAAPHAVRMLVHRCLEKDPRRRLRDIGEARLVLEDPGMSAVAPSPAIEGRRRVRWAVPVLLAAAVVLAMTAAVLGVQLVRDRATARAPVVTRFDVLPPAATSLSVVFRPAISVARNGSAVAFTATSEGVTRIYVRRRDDVEARVIPGSEGGTSPELSPDGRWVVFYADGSIRKAPIDGSATIVAQASDARGLAWSDDDILILANAAAAPLSLLPVHGGDGRELTALAAGERTHRWPDVLPGGRAALFTVGTTGSPDNYDQSSIDAVVLATGERRTVLKGAAMARYCGGGFLLYSKGPALFAVAFDRDRLQTMGNPVQVADAVVRDSSTGAAHFDCADDGTLAFVPGTSMGDSRRLLWADRKGQLQATPVPPGPYQEVDISPDGSSAVLLNGTSGSGDVWLYEFANGTMNRLTFAGTNAGPIFSVDGKTVYYTSFDQSGAQTKVMKTAVDGSREAEQLAAVAGRAYVGWVDPLERSAILTAVNPASDRGDIVRVALGASGDRQPLAATPSDDYAPAVSPGGQWLAYQSNETGRHEVYVRDLTGSGARRQVTASGGEEPHWSHDGRELFYRTADRLMSVPIEPGATLRVGSPRPLFDGVYTLGIESGRSYDVHPSGNRFLLVRPADSGAARTVRIVLNWRESAGR